MGNTPTSRALATRTSQGAPDASPEPGFEASELSLLLKACRKYRGTLPVYLQSVQSELALVDEILRKLQKLVDKG